MFKYFIQLILTLLITITIWTKLYSMVDMRLHPQDIPRWKHKLEIVNDQKLYFETLVMGDSSTDAAIVPRFEVGKRFNMSLGAGTPIDAYFYFTRYLKHHAAPKKLIIGFSPINLIGRDEFYDHALMLNFFSFNELFEIGNDLDKLESLHTRAYEMPAIFFNKLKEKNLISYIYYYELASIQLSLSEYQLSLLENLFIPHVYENNLKRYNDFVSNPNMHIEVPSAPISVRSDRVPKKFIMNTLYKKFMERIVALATSRGISVYIIMTPASKVYESFVKRDSYEDLLNFYKKLSASNSLVHAYPKELFYSADLFEDSLHLKEEGAVLFSQVVNKFISE